MAITSVRIYIQSDNLVTLADLTHSATGLTTDAATVTMSIFKAESDKIFSPDAAVAVVNDGGEAKIKITGHDILVTDFVRIAGSVNYSDQYDLTAVVADNITLTTPFVAETMKGDEILYVGVGGGQDIAMPNTDTGEYQGLIPDSLALVPDDDYYIFVTATDDGETMVLGKKWKAEYYEGV